MGRTIQALSVLTTLLAGCPEATVLPELASGAAVRSVHTVDTPGLVGAVSGPEVDRALAGRAAEFQACVQDRDSTLHVQVVVDEDGTISDMTFVDAGFVTTGTALCLIEALDQVRLPEPDRGFAVLQIAISPV